MKKAFCLLLFFAFAHAAWADDLDSLQGKWSVKKTGDRGAFTQRIEFKKNRWTFRIYDAGDTLVFVAEGDVELKKQGPFSAARFFNIKAGRSEAELDPVDEERNSIYLLDDGQFFLASNFDRVRQEKPSVDAYSKSN